jgi:hypothetical protein
MVGIMLNWGFMGVLCVQICTSLSPSYPSVPYACDRNLDFYHLNFSSDKPIIKLLVYGLFILDILQTALVSADAFHWFVFGFGNMGQLDNTFLNSWDVPLLDAVISLIVQGFYCWRIHIIRGRAVFIPLLIFSVGID